MMMPRTYPLHLTRTEYAELYVHLLNFAPGFDSVLVAREHDQRCMAAELRARMIQEDIDGNRRGQ